MQQNWWKDGIIYQIYPRSFADSNGDGIGDLAGVIGKLTYLKQLGVDIIWLSPVYQSPNEDNGYDISDYRAIMDEFGDMDTFDKLLREVHQRDMKLVMDLVVNHTSDEHMWFQEARKSRENPYRDYYIWKEGDPNIPPNNWQSFFGGSVWKWDEGSEAYYLHLFTEKQPDLNWENPRVRQEIYQLMHFWLQKGVDGFRMDVFSLFSKRQDFADRDMSDFARVIRDVYANGPRIHEFLQEMHREVFEHYDIVSIGEGVGITPENVLAYVDEDRKEIDMIFHFDHMFMDHGPEGRWDRRNWKWEDFFEVFFKWDAALNERGWGSLYLGNHDFPRMVSRFGNDAQYWDKSAKLLATILMTLRGTPTIYQGDEIGMTNVPFPAIEHYRDVEMLSAYRSIAQDETQKLSLLEAAVTQARDHARTPLQWNDSYNAGFSDGTSWIMVNPNYVSINVAYQEDNPESILSFYKRIIAYRKANKTLVYGSLKRIPLDRPDLLAYERSDEDACFLVMMNFSEERVKHGLAIDGYTYELGNYKDVSSRDMDILEPWEARIYKAFKR